MTKTLANIVVLMMLNGCTLFSDTVAINGVVYSPDPNGVIHLAPSELAKLKKTGNFIEGEIPSAVLTNVEYELVKTNEEALFSLVGRGKVGQQVGTLVREGSLESNLRRIVKENGWNELYYAAPGYHVSKPYILQELSPYTAVMNLASGYPLYTCVDEANKVITVIAQD